MTDNYRPISITSAVGEVLESLVNSAVINYLDSNEVLTPNQHGSRQRKPTEINLLDAYEDVVRLLIKEWL